MDGTRARRPLSRDGVLALGLSLATLLLLGLLAARPAHAADFFVVDRSDDPDLTTTPAAGNCTSAANDCSLRGAITRSNSSTADDTIDFDIPASDCAGTTGVCTISPATQLPSITDAVTIDGYTQTGASENTLTTNFNNAVLKVEINGAAASGGPTLTPGLTVIGTGAGGTVIRGLVINRFSLHGIVADADATAIVEGNFIGTDPTGELDRGNGFDGVLVTSSNNRIGGAANAAQNVISGNGRDGVSVAGTGSTGNVIVNNHIGTDADAIDALGNTGDGVAVFASDTVVGGNDQNTGNGAGQDDGTALGEGNIISGNGGHGVLVDNVFAEGTKVQGNHIGVDRNGNRDLGNGLDGVRVSSVSLVEIGGTVDGLGNTISGNGQHGVEIAGTSSTFARVQGNRIGTDYIGRNDLGNVGDGVRLGNVSSATIGDTAAASRNLISGNDANGVFISGTSSATSNKVEGNFIGANVDGTTDLGNAEDGVRVETPGNFVGGTVPEAANTILGNDNQGVQIIGANATGNRILRNSITANGRLAIELQDDGPTANDPKDPDAGPNDLQNFPTVTSVAASGGSASVQGRLDSTPNTTFTVQLFANDAPNIPTGFGEAQRFLGQINVTTNLDGDASFSFDANGVTEGEFVTATATNPAGNTSELSFGVSARAPLVVNSTSDTGDALINDSPSVCDADLGTPGLQCTLRAAIQEANSDFGGAADTIEFDIPGSGVRTISPASPLPAVTQPATIDGYSQPGTSQNTLAVGTNAALRVQLNGAGAGDASGLSIKASDSVVRGLVINRFARGVGIAQEAANSRVEGNFLGTNAAGTAALGNTQQGVAVVGSDDNTIGGITPAARNLVSGNGGSAILVNEGATGNDVEGNLIGTNRNGTGDLGNSGAGVFVSGASGNTIGGATAGAANTVAFNGQDGVAVVNVAGSPATQNRVLRNQVIANGGLGIDLNNDGPTANDTDDPDAGPNTLQNKPVITSATTNTIQGTLNSTPNKTFTIQFFSNPSGNEGKVFLGQRNVTTNANGNATFSFSPGAPVSAGQAITATATRAGNTSEFSAPRTVTG